MSCAKYIPEEFIGQKFGHLSVVALHPQVTSPSARRLLCRCDCGTEKYVSLGNLRAGGTVSCGCRLGTKIRKHGFARRKGAARKPAAYTAWVSAKERCYSVRHPHFDAYGGRGIKMCDPWRDDFTAFYADMGDRPNGFSLERVDVNGDYEPANCKWIPKSEQMDNLRSSIRFEIAGIVHSPKTAAILLGCDAKTVRGYYYQGRIDRLVMRFRPELLAA